MEVVAKHYFGLELLLNDAYPMLRLNILEDLLSGLLIFSNHVVWRLPVLPKTSQNSHSPDYSGLSLAEGVFVFQ